MLGFLILSCSIFRVYRSEQMSYIELIAVLEAVCKFPTDYIPLYSKTLIALSIRLKASLKASSLVA